MGQPPPDAAVGGCEWLGAITRTKRSNDEQSRASSKGESRGRQSVKSVEGALNPPTRAGKKEPVLRVNLQQRNTTRTPTRSAATVRPTQATGEVHRMLVPSPSHSLLVSN